MLLSLLMALHWAGATLWFAGAWAAARVELARARGAASAGAEDLSLHFLYRAGLPGLALALASGAGLFAWNPAYFRGEGWLWAKLALALGPMWATLRLLRAGSPHSERALVWSIRALWVCGGLIILLSCTRPF